MAGLICKLKIEISLAWELCTKSTFMTMKEKKEIHILYLPSTTAILRLTALWALNESGLGGLMFALKIPLTGFFVGGFAVVLIGMIAWYSNCSYSRILQSTLLVLIVKATVSPHSPPPAYLAVAFQGFTGAVLYSHIRSFKTASVLLAVLAMLESALQKVILLTLVFGNSLWSALNKFFAGLVKEFSLPANIDFSLLIIGIYLLLYCCWGLVIGNWTGRLPQQITAHTDRVLALYEQEQAAQTPQPETVVRRQGKQRKLFFFLLTLAFIVAVFLLSGQKGTVGYILLRSVAAILLLFFVLQPIIQSILLRWLKRQSDQRREATEAVIRTLPGLRALVRPAWRLAARDKSAPLARLRLFILYMLILTLYRQPA